MRVCLNFYAYLCRSSCCKKQKNSRTQGAAVFLLFKSEIENAEKLINGKLVFIGGH
jgi:hypothetical protein